MESHEALQRAINRKTKEHARRLGLAWPTVSKWQEPHLDWSASGSINPLDRIEQIIETALILGEPVENAFAPLHYLDQRFGRVCVDAVPTGKGIPELGKELYKSIAEFGDFMRESSRAFKDNRLGKKEKARVLREGGEALRQLAALVEAVRKS